MSETSSPIDTTHEQERLAAWIQFPRCVVLLLLAIALVQAVLAFLPNLLIAPELRGDERGPISLSSGQPVSQLIGDRIPNTLLLLGISFACAIPLIAIFSAIALFVHRLELRAGLLGAVLKGLGRLSVFTLSAAPVLLLATALLWLLVFQLDFGSAVAPGLGDRFNPASLILPVIVLTFAPAALAAQSLSHTLTRSADVSQRASVIGAILYTLGVLFSQVGGMSSSLVLVETLLAMRGIGGLFIDSMLRGDWPLILGALSTFAFIVLAGQLIAELFFWLARLQSGSVVASIQAQPTPGRINARRVWVVLSLALLLIPVAVLVSGAFTDEKLALSPSLSDSNQAPSSEHPWGTDRLGRDLQARVMRGLFSELGFAVVAALVACVISVPLSAIAGYLSTLRTWWADSIADVLLLPVSAALLIPALPLAATFLAIPAGIDEQTSSLIIIVLVLVLLPRASLMFATLWSFPASHPMRFLAVPLAVTLLSVLTGFALMLSLDVLGVGIQPPMPTAGEFFNADNLFVERAVLMPGLIVLMACVSLYTAADALIEYFNNKAVLALRNG
jgi:peptide/nickel transport system permease protein